MVIFCPFLDSNAAVAIYCNLINKSDKHIFQNIFFLCSKEKRKSYRYGMTWGSFVIFGLTISGTSFHISGNILFWIPGRPLCHPACCWDGTWRRWWGWRKHRLSRYAGKTGRAGSGWSQTCVGLDGCPSQSLSKTKVKIKTTLRTVHSINLVYIWIHLYKCIKLPVKKGSTFSILKKKRVAYSLQK